MVCSTESTADKRINVSLTFREQSIKANEKRNVKELRFCTGLDKMKKILTEQSTSGMGTKFHSGQAHKHKSHNHPGFAKSRNNMTVLKRHINRADTKLLDISKADMN